MSDIPFNRIKQEIEYRLMYMGFNVKDVMIQVPLQAVWIATEAALSSMLICAPNLELLNSQRLTGEDNG